MMHDFGATDFPRAPFSRGYLAKKKVIAREQRGRAAVSHAQDEIPLYEENTAGCRNVTARDSVSRTIFIDSLESTTARLSLYI